MSEENDKTIDNEVDTTILVKVENLDKAAEPKKNNYLKIIGGGVLVISLLFLFPLLGNWFFQKTNSETFDSNNELEVKELIRSLKKQLIEASEEAGLMGEKSFLELQNVDLEINYVVKTGNSTSGGAKFYVVTADNASKTDLEKSQKIKLQLKINKEFETTLPTPPGTGNPDVKNPLTTGSTPPKKK